MLKAKALTDADLIAELCRQHNRDRWSSHVVLSDGPMRRALVKAGYIESYRQNPNFRTGRWRWRVTPAGREKLVNYPGSGSTRRDGDSDA